ncbi:MAG TPA: hypothetical protein PLE48_06710 [Thiobacillus sp.]|nr:hypothetical protein [Thiobacillus sp.]HQT70095.1 hypothetical protein [Thiobacillus sp.]
MSNHIYLLAGATLLLAGAAHGEATDQKMEKESLRAEQMLTPEPPASIATMDASRNQSKTEESAKPQATAKPVYLNGGYFGALGE